MTKKMRFVTTLILVATAEGLVARHSSAQQTLFNVPSADVLDAGKVYLEEDNLWRPGRPEDTFFTARGVAGLGDHLEAGLNLGGFVAEGRSVPTGTLALKWQPVHSGAWAFTAGVHGLFFLRGSTDGSPSAHVYGHAAFTPADGTRITGGAWYSTSGYADTGVTRGILAGFEQRIVPSLNFQADWYSGHNEIGYFTPGFALTLGKWVVYAGYSFKNEDSHENAVLIEVGLYL